MGTRLILLPLMLLSWPAKADSPIAEVLCAPRDEMVARLRGSYGAEIAGTGLRSEEAMIEVWAAPDGDWTLVQSYVDGQSCILAMGEAWDMPLQPPPA
jgi:hypothetical protein